MNFLSYILAISGLLSLLLLYNLSRKSPKNENNSKIINSAPEPPGAWPVIGHLHLLGGQIPVYRVLAGLANNHGPIFIVRLGVYPALVISSWEAVKDCFTTNDKIFAKRPVSSHGKYLGYNYAAFGFVDGIYWREMRKLVVQEVLSVRRLELMKHVQESEIKTSIKELYKYIQGTNNPGKVVVNISEWLENLTLNLIMKMICGKRYITITTNNDIEIEEGRSFRKVIKEFMYISGKFVVSDIIPFPPLRWIDFLGHSIIKSMKRIANELSTIFERWIAEHIERTRDNVSSDDDEKDFIDVMLSAVDDRFTGFGHTRETIIKATIMNIILAGSDTTSVHLTWILSLLANHRQVLNQAQQEIDTKIGKERWVQEADIKNLLYLQAIVKETLRLYPPGPLGVPHEATEDCRVAGYDIPKGTRLMVNLWKLHRDPSIWQEPDRFIPERFLTSHAEVDFTGHHHEFIPFGSGRKSCPGITFAMQVTHLTLARLLQGFDFRTPSDVPVDMTEGLGVTLPKVTPLEVVIAPRLSSFMYLS